MKLILLTALITALLGTQTQAQQPSPTPAPAPSPSYEPKTIETSIHSTILGEDRRLIIHLPRNYGRDATQKYPVMYVLDGTSQDQHTTDKLTVLADAGLAPAAIVVGIPNTRGNRERDQTPPFMRRDVNDPQSAFGAGDKFFSFIEKELIPYIDSKHQSSGYRTLTGNSRGGLFVWYVLMEKPNLFQAWFCYSAPVWRFENLMVNRVAEFLRRGSAINGFLYLSVGDKETEQMTGGFSKMLEALRNNRKKTFRWAADYTPFAVHQDNALISTSKGLAEWGKFLRENRK